MCVWGVCVRWGGGGGGVEGGGERLYTEVVHMEFQEGDVLRREGGWRLFFGSFGIQQTAQALRIYEKHVRKISFDRETRILRKLIIYLHLTTLG